MQKEFKPIAMRCTQEQFERVKEEIEKKGGLILCINPNWEHSNWLVNDYNCKPNCFTNFHQIIPEHRVLYETFDKKILFESCGWEWEEPKGKLIGYKLNTDMDVTKKQLSVLLDGEIFENNGFIWSGGEDWIKSVPSYNRAVELNIIGEDKMLVPVYEEIKEQSEEELLASFTESPKESKESPEPEPGKFKKGDELIFLWDRNAYSIALKSLHGTKVVFDRYTNSGKAQIDCMISNSPGQTRVKIESLYPIVSKEKRASMNHQLYGGVKAFVAIDNDGKVVFEIVYIEADYNFAMGNMIPVLDTDGRRHTVPCNAIYYFAD